MTLFERHRGLWRSLRAAAERRRRGDLNRNRQLALEVLELRVTPTTSTWSGAALDGSWMDNGNWDVPPASGNDLVFPADAMSQTNTNDLAAGISYGNLTITSSTTAGGYVISGNGNSIADGDRAMSLDDSSPGLRLPTCWACRSSSTIPRACPSIRAGATLALDRGRSRERAVSRRRGPRGFSTWSGANAYSAATTVNGGVLYVNTTQRPAARSRSIPVRLSGGTGTVGGITANSSGTVSPGTSTPAMLLDNGNLTLSSGSTFAATLNGLTPGTGYSQLTVTGSVALNGATLSATALPMGTGNNQFIIIDNPGGQPVSGTFAGLASR